MTGPMVGGWGPQKRNGASWEKAPDLNNGKIYNAKAATY
jgi:hypothetical protein